MNKFFWGVTASAALALTAPAHSQEVSNALQPFLGADAGGGGDTLVTIPFSDGSKIDLTAGGGITLKGGARYRFSPLLSASASVGLQLQYTPASNGSVTFTRFPFELMGHIHFNEAWSLGAGMRSTQNPHLSGEGKGALPPSTITSAPGTAIRGEFQTGAVGLYLQWSNEKLTVNGAPFKADRISFGLNYYFEPQLP